jgi:hypothetical protein
MDTMEIRWFELVTMIRDFFLDYINAENTLLSQHMQDKSGTGENSI